MVALAALILAQSTPWVFDDPAASKAAADIFREACTQGAISLPPERGRILKEDEVTDFVDVLEWGTATTTKTVIKFHHPRATFLVFADYKGVKKGIAKDCVVVSRVLSLQDALAALIETAPDIELRPTMVPNTRFPEWIIDLPKRGFRSRALVRRDRSILLELSTYAWAMNRNPSSRTTQ